VAVRAPAGDEQLSASERWRDDEQDTLESWWKFCKMVAFFATIYALALMTAVKW
jgi:hypothetical protein